MEVRSTSRWGRCSTTSRRSSRVRSATAAICSSSTSAPRNWRPRTSSTVRVRRAKGMCFALRALRFVTYTSSRDDMSAVAARKKNVRTIFGTPGSVNSNETLVYCDTASCNFPQSCVVNFHTKIAFAETGLVDPGSWRNPLVSLLVAQRRWSTCCTTCRVQWTGRRWTRRRASASR